MSFNLKLQDERRIKAGAYVAQNVHKTKHPHAGYGRFLEILILFGAKPPNYNFGFRFFLQSAPVVL
jgi:hypothetical protein